MWQDFLQLIFPEYFLACQGPLERGEQHLCTSCRYSLPRYNLNQTELPELSQRFWGRLPLSHAWAYLKFSKGSRVQHLLHELKYNNHPEIGQALGRFMGAELASAGFGLDFDLIVPVPLHPDKLKKRGYNQSDAFAEGLGESLQTPWSESTLTRTAATETQTRKKRYERWENVGTRFQLTDQAEIANKKILLVDDVVTTGATLEACGQTLLQGQCQSVSLDTIAMA